MRRKPQLSGEIKAHINARAKVIKAVPDPSRRIIVELLERLLDERASFAIPFGRVEGPAGFCFANSRGRLVAGFLCNPGAHVPGSVVRRDPGGFQLRIIEAQPSLFSDC